MTSYHSHGVKLSDNQKAKLAKALKNNSAITIRLAKNELSGHDMLMLTKTQINSIKKAMRNGTGVDIKISKSQIRKAVMEGGSLWSSLEQNSYLMLQKQSQKRSQHLLPVRYLVGLISELSRFLERDNEVVF